jgi:superfamily II DNA or RNA helicase
MYRSSVLVVDKAELSKAERQRIHDDLSYPNPVYHNTLAFSKYKPSPDIPREVMFYQEMDGNLILPRNYPVEFKNPQARIKNKTTLGDPIRGLQFTRDLRRYQVNFFKKIDWEHETDICMCCPCGHGKTTMGIHTIYRYKVKTIVFVNTHFLARQWMKRIRTFTNKEPFMLTSGNYKKFNVEDHDIIICTLDTFRSIIGNNTDDFMSFVETGKYTGELEFINHFGLTIFDEAHRIGANEYEPVVTAIPAKYRLTLTATLRRGDGREKMLVHHFGTVYVMPNIFPPAHYYGFDTGIKYGHIIDRKTSDKLKLTPLLDQYKIDYIEYTKYLEVFINFKQLKLIENDGFNKIKLKRQLSALRTPPKNSTLESFVVTIKRRQHIIDKLLKKLAAEGRTILVLSKRKHVLKMMYERYVQMGYTCALVISETSNAKDEDALEELMSRSTFIFGIAQLAQEGLDCDSLDTVVTLHPIGDPEQLIGRTKRQKKDKLQALAIQVIDNFRQFLAIWDKSITFAKNTAEIKGVKKYNELLKII